ncbi:MAG: hypothetical protein ACRDYZ_01615 [Acidimicrobiales bacterium]
MQWKRDPRPIAGAVACGVALLAAGCGGPTTSGAGAAARSNGTTTTSTWPAHDPETAAALLRIGRAFNEDYAHNRDAAVYARWDAASRAIISRRDYVQRHKDCPSATGAPVHTWGVAHSAGVAWLVHYSIGGIQFTDYWYYQRGRFVFDLPKSNPSSVELYRLSPARYAKAVGCNH